MLLKCARCGSAMTAPAAGFGEPDGRVYPAPPSTPGLVGARRASLPGGPATDGHWHVLRGLWHPCSSGRLAEGHVWFACKAVASAQAHPGVCVWGGGGGGGAVQCASPATSESFPADSRHEYRKLGGIL